jgi:hypothetical protein
VLSLLRADFRSRPVAGVASLLRHADMRVRQKAQFELARRGDVQPFLATARDASAGFGRLHAIWGIAQLARRQPTHASHLAQFLADPDAEVRAQAAKMIGDVRYAAAGDKLVPLLKDSAPRVQFFAAEALGRIAHKPATAALVSMLAANDERDVYLRHAGSLALASIGDAAALEALAQHESRAVRLAAVVALRRMGNAGAARFLADKDELVVVEAARAINDDGGIEGGLGASRPTLGEARFRSEPLLRRGHQRESPARARPRLPERVAAFAVRHGEGRRGRGRCRFGARRLVRPLAARSRRRLSPGQRPAAVARRLRRSAPRCRRHDRRACRTREHARDAGGARAGSRPARDRGRRPDTDRATRGATPLSRSGSVPPRLQALKVKTSTR